MPDSAEKAVFLSYAREDTAAAQRIAEALRSHGVEVWFDQNELRGGDSWDQKIRRQIRECALFMPIISAHTQGRHEGYFRLEWKLAVERTHLMADGVPFLVPVAVDETSDSAAVVPGEFVRVQWHRLPGALPTPQFVEQVKRLLAAPRVAAMPSSPVGQPHAAATNAPRKSRMFGAVAALLIVAALGLAAHFAESIQDMRKAGELDPGNAYYAGNLTSSLAAGRRCGEALAQQRRVIELMPASVEAEEEMAELAFSATGSTKAFDDWLATLTPAQTDSPRIREYRKHWTIIEGDFPEWRRLDAVEPWFDDDSDPHWHQAIAAATILAAYGDKAGATARLAGFPAAVRAALQLEPANTRLTMGLSMMEALLGQKEQALRDARKAVGLLPESQDAITGPMTGYNLAAVYAWTGDKDRAIAELVRLARVPVYGYEFYSGYISSHLIRSNAAFAPLRGDPRFEALLDDPKHNEPLF